MPQIFSTIFLFFVLQKTEEMDKRKLLHLIFFPYILIFLIVAFGR